MPADPDRRMLLFRVLEQAGHRATVVDGAAAALALLEVEPFDAVLLDGSATDRDSAELLRRRGAAGVRPGAGRPPVLRVAAQPGEENPGAPGTGDGVVLTESFLAAVVGACVEAVVARAGPREAPDQEASSASRSSARPATPSFS